MLIIHTKLINHRSCYQEPNSGFKITHPLDLENLRESQEWYDTKHCFVMGKPLVMLNALYV